jgi:hypothetical protein
MAEITLPEVNLPEVKLPEGLREMSRDDIVRAAKDIHLPRKLDLPDIDLSKAGLPKQVTDRLPGRRRTNPILPVAIFLGVAAAIGAAWYLVTSPVTGPRVRVALSDLRTRVTGERRDLVRYDDERDLTSLLPDRRDPGASVVAGFENASTVPDIGAPNGSEPVGSTAS